MKKQKIDIDKEFKEHIELADLIEVARSLSSQIRTAKLTIDTMTPALHRIKKKIKKLQG
jgi:hypothetical protein